MCNDTEKKLNNSTNQYFTFQRKNITTIIKNKSFSIGLDFVHIYTSQVYTFSYFWNILKYKQVVW